MAYRLVILDSADADREEIVRFLVEEAGNPSAAKRFLDDMDRESRLIAQFPTIHNLSRVLEVADRGYRTALFGNYIMLYRFEDDVVYIAHIFHQRQDYARLV